VRILIIGGGSVTYELLSTISKHKELKKHDIAVVEINPRRAEEISKAFDVTVVNGDATDISLFESQATSSINLSDFDVVIALTDRDEVNVFVLTLAKHYGVNLRMARVKSSKIADMLVKLDLGIPVIVPSVIGNIFRTYLDTLTEPKILGEVGEYKIYGIVLTSTDKATNKKVEELQLPEDVKIMFMFNGVEFTIPSKEDVLKEGTLLYVLAKETSVEDITKIFKG